MKSKADTPRTVGGYIAGFPPQVQSILRQLRAIIRKAVPGAQEAIKYQIPTYSLDGNILSFAAYRKHVALYPMPAGDAKFKRDLLPYRSGKSAAKFPLDRPIPFALINRIVKFRVKEHLKRVADKGTQY